MDDDLENFLAHYGVKGMKWGVRKDRGAKRQARRNTRAKKYETRSSNLQSRINRVSSSSNRNALSQKVANVRVSQLKRRKEQADRDAQAKREGKLSRGQKQMVVGALAVAATIAAYKTVDSGEFNRLAQKGKSYLEGNSGSPTWKKKDMLASDKWDADALEAIVVSKINPDYGAVGTKNNCRRATFAYEMRRRGYDVKASKTVGATGQNVSGLHNALSPGQRKVGSSKVSQLGRITTDAVRGSMGESTPFSDLITKGGSLGANRISSGTNYANSIFDSLSSQPNGARGELGVSWKMGGGHSMAWEVVQGKPVIFDAQNGKRYSSPSDLAKVATAVKGAGFTRLDNVELDQNFLMRWLRDA